MTGESITTKLATEDRELVDLLRAVLVDPNLYTDRRMRLHRKIGAVLCSARHDLYGDSADGPEDELVADADRLPDLLTRVLVDPNLYTDRRMRLHREIRALIYGTEGWLD
jgi:hypothetical protein